MVRHPGHQPPPASPPSSIWCSSKTGRYQGFVAQEQFRLPDILANRFGRHYAAGGTKHLSGEVVVAGKSGHQRRKKAVSA